MPASSSRGLKRDADTAGLGPGPSPAPPPPMGAVAEATSPAVVWMAGTFGPDWRSEFHYTHSLRASPPIVFCVRCGRQTGTRSHLLGMRSVCLAAHGELPRGSTAASRRNALADGRNPLRDGAPLSSTPVRLPSGTRHELGAQ